MKQFIELQQKFQDRIDSIMDNYEFDKVEKVMQFLDWKWATKELDFEVPDIYEIKKHARKLLHDIVDSYVQEGMNDEKNYYISCGGFTARIQYGEIGLTFEVESWDEPIDIEDDEI